METKQSTAPAGRDKTGRFVKGQSGNPRGRAPLPPEFKDYAKESPAKLWEIANDETTPVKVRTDILQWMTEMYFGKSPQALDIDGKLDNPGATVIRFEGALDEWSK